MTALRVRILTLAACLAAVARPTSAQDGSPIPMPASPDAIKAVVCDSAVRVLRSSASPRARGEALSAMTPSRCKHEAPAILAELWRSAGDADIDALVFASSTFGDRRLLNTVEQIAADGARPRSIRLAALSVLVSYAVPSAYVRFPAGVPAREIFIGDRSDMVQRDGPQPLSRGDRRSVVTRLQRIASLGGDTEVSDAAATLARQIQERLDRPRKQK